MKIAMKGLIRDEKGQAMVLALIMLLIGGLVSAPLLSHMGTGIVAGEVYEVKTAELYAADAGVEDAVWNIQHPEEADLPSSCGDPTRSYNITNAINGKKVDVTITWVNNLTYRVVSTATGDGSGAQIEAYITGANKYGDYSGVLDNVITSQNDIDYPPHPDIHPSEGEHAPVANYIGPWPTVEELVAWYWQDVEGATHYDGETEIDPRGNNCPPSPIYINGEAVDCPSGLGPLSIDGTLTEITNSINPPATLVLAGTIYINGDAIINPTKDLILDLNGYTIFVNGALDIKGKCGIKGPGAIIAAGDIWFEPNIEAGDTDPVFLMSVEGTTTLKPGGDFYGAVAGSVEVELYPGTSLVYPEEEGWYEGFNFPVGIIQELVYTIASWTVGQQ